MTRRRRRIRGRRRRRGKRFSGLGAVGGRR